MLSAIKTIVWRDLVFYARNRSELISPLMFFIMVTALFSIALGAQPANLNWAAAGIIWVAAILATLLSLDRIFRADFEDGIIDQLLMSPYPLPVLVCAKSIAHWLAIGLPLVIVTPILAMLLQIKPATINILCITLLLGTPALSLIGSIGVSLTIGLKRGGMLLAVIVLPLYIPILIFGSGGIVAAAYGQSAIGHLALLLAILILATLLAPFAVASALKVSLT